MNVSYLHFLSCTGLVLVSSALLEAEEPLTIGGVHGGLVVQVGADESDAAARLSRTGRYLIHLLDVASATVEKARKIRLD